MESVGNWEVWEEAVVLSKEVEDLLGSLRTYLHPTPPNLPQPLPPGFSPLLSRCRHSHHHLQLYTLLIQSMHSPKNWNIDVLCESVDGVQVQLRIHAFQPLSGKERPVVYGTISKGSQDQILNALLQKQLDSLVDICQVSIFEVKSSGEILSTNEHADILLKDDILMGRSLFDVISLQEREEDEFWTSKNLMQVGEQKNVGIGCFVIRRNSKFQVFVKTADDSEFFKTRCDQLQSCLSKCGDFFWEWNKISDCFECNLDFWLALGHDPQKYRCSHTQWTSFKELLSYVHPDDLYLFKNSIDAHFVSKRPFEACFRIRNCDSSYTLLRCRAQGRWNRNVFNGEARSHQLNEEKAVGMLGYFCSLTRLNSFNIISADLAIKTSPMINSAYLERFIRPEQGIRFSGTLEESTLYIDFIDDIFQILGTYKVDLQKTLEIPQVSDTSSSQPTSKTFYDFVVHEDKEYVWKCLSLLNSTPSMAIKYRIQTSDSVTKWLTQNFIEVKKDAGKLEFVGVLYDITQRKLSELSNIKSAFQLKEANLALEEAQSLGHFGNWSFNSKTQVIELSKNSFHILGLSSSDLRPLSWSEYLSLFQYDSASSLEKTVQELLCNGEPFSQLLYTKNCKVLRNEGRSQCPDGSIEPKTILIIGVLIDVTEEFNREEALKRANQRADEAQEIAKMGDWVLDVKTGKVEWSKQLFKLFNYHSDSKKFDVEDAYRQFHPEDLHKLKECVYRAIHHGEPYSVICRTMPKELQEGKSLVKFIRSEGRIKRNAAGEIIQVFGTSTDITSDFEREEAIKVAHLKAEESNRFKSQFLANMSHEIRTPMNGVIGMIELLLESGLNAEQKELARMSRESAKCLLTIVNDILDFSKIEAGKLLLTMREFKVRDILTRLSHVFSSKVSQKRLNYIYDVDHSVPEWLLGDGDRLQQIFLNLIGNAIKFTNEGGMIKTTVKCDIMDSQCNLRVSVLDSGIGIPQEAQASIFEAFTQADPTITRKFGGTGLGLSISSQLVKLMNGDISVKSTAGLGSEFIFNVILGLCSDEQIEKAELNLTSPQFGEPSRRLDPSKISDDPPPMTLESSDNGVVQKSLSILLAEDNIVNQKLVCRLLERFGHQVAVANNGKEAFDMFVVNPQRFHLILMDIHMPIMSGEEAVQLIRKHSAVGAEIPIVALTANAMRGDRERYLQIGFSAYTPKPIDRRELFKILDRFSRCLEVQERANNPEDDLDLEGSSRKRRYKGKV